jgi:hypothetical protein
MSRRSKAALVAISAALLFSGLPIFGFFVTAHVERWGFSTWVQVLIPNLMLVVIVGGFAGGVYLLATRPPNTRP